MAERTTVRLPDTLLARARKKASEEGRTLTSLIEEGLRTVLARRDTENILRTRKPLPVSSARGGLHPGQNLDHMADLYEQEDLEDMARLRRSFRE